MQTQRLKKIDWSSWVIGTSLVLVTLSIAHLLQDFAYGIPARLGISMIEALIVLGGFYAIQVITILLAAAEHKEGYLGSLVFGVIWLIAAIADVGGILVAWPHGGLLFNALVIGVILSALAVIVCSVAAWRAHSVPAARRPIGFQVERTSRWHGA